MSVSPAIAKKKSLVLFLGVAFLLYTLFTTPPEGISVAAWKTIGVTLLMATWWMLEAIPIAVTALVPLVLFPGARRDRRQAGCSELREQPDLAVRRRLRARLRPWKTWNLHRRVSLIVLKVCGTNPKMLILGFMIATGFLSAWMSNTACAALMMPIGMAIVEDGAGR